MGRPGSPVWCAMLDSADAILREEGYGELTSRRIAERTGVKQRLVYYYFRTMDDLIAETFRRHVKRDFARLQAASDARRPLRELWNICINSIDARLVTEFMALAHRNSALRKDVITYIEESRRIQVGALTAALKRSSRYGTIAPEALAILATSSALALNREAAIGVSFGHDEILAAIEGFIAAAEPIVAVVKRGGRPAPRRLRK